ncbi:hypothetical protein ACWX0P_17630 [Vibrio mediterranei]
MAHQTTNLVKSNIGISIRSRREHEQAKAELNFLQENLSELVAYDIDTFFQRVAELTNAIEIYDSIQSNKQGFYLDKKSEITPEELALAGFIKTDTGYHPATLSVVEHRLHQHFKMRMLDFFYVIWDVSTTTERIYSFDRCPF